MEKLLLEEINRFKLLSLYDTELTLSENYMSLEEQRQYAKYLVNYGDDAIRQVAGQAKKLPMFKNMADDAVESFFKTLQQGKGNAKQITQFQDELLKSGIKGGQLGGLADAAVDGYVKQLLNSKASIATQFKGAAKNDRIQMLRNAGYPETTINSIIKKTDELAGVAKQTTNVAQDAVTAGRTTTQATGDVAKKGIVQKGLDTARKYKDKLINSLKTSGWKKTLAVAAGLGVGAGALWMLATENKATAADMPPQQPQVDQASTGESNKPAPQRYQIPAELGDVKGVQAFQNWLDANHPGWIKKYNTLGGDPKKGFGKFGPNTNAAWQDPVKKDAYLKVKEQQKQTDLQSVSGYATDFDNSGQPQ